VDERFRRQFVDCDADGFLRHGGGTQQQQQEVEEKGRWWARLRSLHHTES